jgi:hypothetical protein
MLADDGGAFAGAAGRRRAPLKQSHALNPVPLQVIGRAGAGNAGPNHDDIIGSAHVSVSSPVFAGSKPMCVSMPLSLCVSELDTKYILPKFSQIECLGLSTPRPWHSGLGW